MKRRWITTFVTLLTLTLLAGSLLAEKTRDRAKSDDKAGTPKQAGQRRDRGKNMPDIGLTDDQKTAIEAIRKTAMPKIKDAKPEERKALFAQMQKDVHALFTKAQLEKLKKAREHGGGGQDRPDLGLTDEQQKQMAVIRKKGLAKMKDAKPEERKAIFEGMRKQIEKILTPEQFKKFEQARRGQRRGGMPDVGLSDDQKTQIEAIRKKAMEEAEDKDGEDRKAIFEKMKKDIHALLTDEQIEKLKKAREGQRRDGEKAEGKDRGNRKNRGGARGGKKRSASE